MGPSLGRERGPPPSASSPEAYAAIKANRTGPVMATIEAGLEERQAEFVDLWYSPEARTNLEEALLKF